MESKIVAFGIFRSANTRAALSLPKKRCCFNQKHADAKLILLARFAQDESFLGWRNQFQSSSFSVPGSSESTIFRTAKLFVVCDDLTQDVYIKKALKGIKNNVILSTLMRQKKKSMGKKWNDSNQITVNCGKK